MAQLDKQSAGLSYTIRHLERALRGAEGALGDAKDALDTAQKAGFDLDVAPEEVLSVLEIAGDQLRYALAQAKAQWAALGREPWETL